MIGGWRRYSLISSKASWYSLFHVCGSFFLRSLKMGSQVEVSMAMNRLMYCNRLKKLLISFSLLGGGISNMTLIILDGSISIPLSLTRKPSNFPVVTPKVHFCGFNLNLYSLILSKEQPQVYGTPKVHFCGFNLNLYSLILSKNSLKFMVWLPLSLYFIIISSTYTSTSLCIISCSKAIAILW